MAYTTINKSSEHFNTVTYTGNTSAGHAITGVGFQPDLTWNKSRANATPHYLFDVIRGATNFIKSDSTSAESQNTDTLTSFDSDGFTLGNATGNNGSGSFASWNWKANGAGSANTDGTISSTVSANTTSGFSIVSWSGTGSNATIGHGLGTPPTMIIVKEKNGTSSWITWQKGLSSYKHFLLLNTNGTQTDSYNNFQNVAPTNTVFSIGTEVGTNRSTGTYIAYCFAEKQGFSKFSSYTGNGNDDGTFIYTGFKPAFIMIKAANLTENWWIMDSKRSSFNIVQNLLQANLSNAELVGNVNFKFDMLSNGFKLRDVDGAYNNSGQNYIYMAFAEAPLVGTNGVTAKAR